MPGLVACFCSLIFLSGFAQSSSNTGTTGKPRIGIAGLGIESSTFSPAVTHEEAFHAKYGDTIFTSYPFLSEASPLRQQATWLPTLVGKSLPGGAVTREAYESLLGQMLDLLKKNGPYDGLFLDIHGAMSVVGLDDPEGDFITRIRDVIGFKTLISTSMDFTRQCVLAAGPKLRPHHLLPHGSPRRCHAKQRTGRNQPPRPH